MKKFKSFPIELAFWVVALVSLAFSDPNAHAFTLCPLANLGLEAWCPGCGLGRSISYLFHGSFTQSFQQHWFGLPALLIILYRIAQLLKKKKDYTDLTQIAN
ncbi:hypothetical protein ABIB40_001123 [Pedobacter sp. UYP30]|uniref:DUF2752 domain-containing protein n=1 Tax=Pedobacter sp. UYP30 TaxID=1756400 RepID=UPI0033996720